MKRTTIQDVAAQAGVSYQTVSRVLNQRPDVSIETRQRVLKVMEEMDYQPSTLARGFSTQRSFTIGMLTVDYTDYFFSGVCQGADDEAHKHGFMILMTSIQRKPENARQYIQEMVDRRVDGLLLIRDTNEVGQPDYLHDLMHTGMPIVTTCHGVTGVNLTLVDVDNQDGGYQATRHLLERGHRRIAIITAPQDFQSARDRMGGAHLAMLEYGVASDPDLVIDGNWEYGGGFRAMQSLLGRGKSFSAVFIHNDLMAMGALRAIQLAGLRVPEDISLIGFDDNPVAEYIDPPLTTVWQPRLEVGTVAMRMLIDIIEGRAITGQGRMLLKPRLVERNSVRRMPIP